MPSRKKKSKAKGRKPAAGKGGAKKAAEKVTVNEQKQGTLNSEMQRLKIGEQKGDEDDVEAMLEEAIKLAAIEEQEIKVKEKENCTHGYNPSSRFQARHCEDFLEKYMEAFYATTRGNSRIDRSSAANAALHTALTTTSVSGNRSNAECINSCSLAEGTKFILGGKSDDACLCAVLSLAIKNAEADKMPDYQKMLELLDGDEHTLVQFFRKHIPCSCLDEKYKEVKSVPKMGICFNEKSCPLPGCKAVRRKMFRCTGCKLGVSYCSRACQEANWHVHKKYCGKTVQEIRAQSKN